MNMVEKLQLLLKKKREEKKNAEKIKVYNANCMEVPNEVMVQVNTEEDDGQ